MITRELFKMQDVEYKKFQSSLIPNINPDTVIGVRTPLIRKLAKDMKDEAESFLGDLPHRYYEENNLHGFLISAIPDYGRCVELIDKFLPYVDNWATCDGIRPICFKKNKTRLISDIRRWAASDNTYTVRFGIEMLMLHFLDEGFKPEYHELVSGIHSGEYYINMMIAWYFATALAKQWDKTVGYLENKLLDTWIHNKTIQKALESHRTDDDQKSYLRRLKTV